MEIWLVVIESGRAGRLLLCRGPLVTPEELDRAPLAMIVEQILRRIQLDGENAEER